MSSSLFNVPQLSCHCVCVCQPSRAQTVSIYSPWLQSLVWYLEELTIYLVIIIQPFIIHSLSVATRYHIPDRSQQLPHSLPVCLANNSFYPLRALTERNGLE